MTESDRVRAHIERDGGEVRDLGAGAWVSVGHPNPNGQIEHEAAMAGMLSLLKGVLRPAVLFVGGREVKTPRLVSWHANPGRSYRFAGADFAPNPWGPVSAMTVFRAGLLRSIGVDFNGCLVNHYRDGADSIAWHSDDEPEMGPRQPDDVIVAAVSLGAMRRFVLRRKADKTDRVELELGGGNVVVMGGACQRDWEHSVPKTTKPVGPRMSLTYRVVVRP